MSEQYAGNCSYFLDVDLTHIEWFYCFLNPFELQIDITVALTLHFQVLLCTLSFCWHCQRRVHLGCPLVSSTPTQHLSQKTNEKLAQLATVSIKTMSINKKEISVSAEPGIWNLNILIFPFWGTVNCESAIAVCVFTGWMNCERSVCNFLEGLVK